MQKKQNDNLTQEEKEILESYEVGEWQSIKDPAEVEHLVQSAKNTLRKNARINIRLPQMTLLKLKSKAVEEGLPYQTFISSLLYKYTQGRLLEV